MSVIITADTISRFSPRPANARQGKIWDGYIDAITSPAGQRLLQQFGVTTSLRWAYAVTTWHVECGGFTLLRENLSYTADRILVVFRDKGITTKAEADRLAGNPYALGERVYGLGCERMARMLGNTMPGDGYKFRGVGLEQLTGRANQERAAARIGCSVEDLEDPLNSLHGALIEWQEKGCNALCDQDDGNATDMVARRVRKAINGGTNGLPQFRTMLAKAKKVWPSGVYPSRIQGMAQIGDSADHGTKRAQELLIAAGYPCGAADGNFGPLTERALAGFQVAHGLPGTGKLDKETWESLKDAAANPGWGATVAREDLTLEDLRERGSATVASADKVEMAGRATVATTTGVAVDKALDLGLVDTALDRIDQVQSLATRSNKFIGLLMNPKFIGLALALGLGFALIYWGRRINWARLSDAITGKNVAR